VCKTSSSSDSGSSSGIIYSNFTVTVCRAARQLKNEAKAHVLKHVNVVTLYAMVFEPRHYGIVLEFVPNGCLEEYIDQNKVLFNLTFIYVKNFPSFKI